MTTRSQMKLEDRLKQRGWVSLRLASELTGVSTATIRYLVKKGEVKGMKVGGRMYINRQGLAEYYAPIRDMILSG